MTDLNLLQRSHSAINGRRFQSLVECIMDTLLKNVVFLLLCLPTYSVIASDKLPVPDGSLIFHENSRKLIEYCPDNTYNLLLVSKAIPDSELDELLALYFYYASGYIELEKGAPGKTAFRKKYRKHVTAVLGRYADRCGKSEFESVSCILKYLARKWNLQVEFVRYDGGEKHVTPQDLASRFSVIRLKATADWYQKQ